LRILIVHHDTAGLAHDARVLASAVRARRPEAEILVRTVDARFGSDPELSFPVESEPGGSKAGFDAIFLLGHAYLEPKSFVKERFGTVLFVPDIDRVNAKDETALVSGAIDAVLFKTRHAERVAAGRPAFREVASRHLVGWTSEDVRLADAGMRFDRALHVRGMSRQKQTATVLETWSRHGAMLPPLEVFARVEDPFRLPAPATISGNTVLHLGEVSRDKVIAAMNSRGLHVCPSSASGFGHSLNEARAVGAVAITTGAAPMNELIADEETGFLVPSVPGPGLEGMYVGQELIDAAGMLETMERAMSWPDRRLREMGALARRDYEAGKAGFEERLGAVVSDLATRKSVGAGLFGWLGRRGAAISP